MKCRYLENKICILPHYTALLLNCTLYFLVSRLRSSLFELSDLFVCLLDVVFFLLFTLPPFENSLYLFLSAISLMLQTVTDGRKRLRYSLWLVADDVAFKMQLCFFRKFRTQRCCLANRRSATLARSYNRLVSFLFPFAFFRDSSFLHFSPLALYFFPPLASLRFYFQTSIRIQNLYYYSIGLRFVVVIRQRGATSCQLLIK